MGQAQNAKTVDDHRREPRKLARAHYGHSPRFNLFHTLIALASNSTIRMIGKAMGSIKNLKKIQ
jgi:hypothetical protein